MAAAVKVDASLYKKNKVYCLGLQRFNDFIIFKRTRLNCEWILLYDIYSQSVQMGSRRSHEHFSHAHSEKKVDNGLIFIKNDFFALQGFLPTPSALSSGASDWSNIWYFGGLFIRSYFFLFSRKIKKNRRIIMEKICWIACFVSVYFSVMKFFQKNIFRKKMRKNMGTSGPSGFQKK